MVESPGAPMIRSVRLSEGPTAPRSIHLPACAPAAVPGQIWSPLVIPCVCACADTALNASMHPIAILCKPLLILAHPPTPGSPAELLVEKALNPPICDGMGTVSPKM